MVDIHVVWRANEDPQLRGQGTDVPPDSAEAFLGRMARAECTGRASAVRTGFSFRTKGELGRNGYMAELGRSRNGVFL